MSKEQGELDEVQGQQEPTVPVVSEPVTDADLVPDNEGVQEVDRTDRVGGLNAGGAFGHTPDHGDANASRLAGDPESDGAGDDAEDE